MLKRALFDVYVLMTMFWPLLLFLTGVILSTVSFCFGHWVVGLLVLMTAFASAVGQVFWIIRSSKKAEEELGIH